MDFLKDIIMYKGLVFPYSEYASISIGLGMILSLFLTETLGVMAGGIIVPGYFALYLHNPLMIVVTFSISFITYLTVLFLSKFMLIYGRRRLILCLLLGFFLGYVFRILIVDLTIELNYIGFIIPVLK